ALRCSPARPRSPARRSPACSPPGGSAPPADAVPADPVPVGGGRARLGHDDPVALRRPITALAALLALAIGSLAACSDQDEPASPADAQAVNPYADHAGYPDPHSKTAQAAAISQDEGTPDQQRIFPRLAAVPQGIWLTPEQYSPGEVRTFVTGVVADAGKDAQVPTFVVYGIPDRDCTGGFSEGGLSAEEYGPWVQEIADGISAGDSSAGVAVVVEP